MIEQMYWACADALTLATQLGSARDLPPADVLSQRISGVFDQMADKARGARISDEDVMEAKYALCAFIDEQILRSEWPGRQQWMSRPLQLMYFNENTAGEGFFMRMDRLEAQPQRIHVLQIYFLCLTLGFQGQYAVRGGEGLAPVIERVGSRLSRALPRSDQLSPHGELAGGARSAVRREAPVMALSVAVIGLAVVAFVVLRVIVSTNADSAAKSMQNFAQTSPK